MNSVWPKNVGIHIFQRLYYFISILVEPNYFSSEQTAIMIVLILFSITLFITMATAHERPSLRNLSNGNIINGDLENNSVNFESDTERLLMSKPAMTISPICSFITFKKFVVNSFRISFILAYLIKVSWLKNDKKWPKMTITWPKMTQVIHGPSKTPF